MSLDFAECDRARLARDPVYDGRFYTGVHSTGIYCRPVCPVRPARSGNVSFFPSAAAAEAAIRPLPASKSFEGGQDGTGAAGQTAERRDEPADDRDRDAGGLWQSAPVQLRLRRSLRQTAD